MGTPWGKNERYRGEKMSLDRRREGKDVPRQQSGYKKWAFREENAPHQPGLCLAAGCIAF